MADISSGSNQSSETPTMAEGVSGVVQASKSGEHVQAEGENHKSESRSVEVVTPIVPVENEKPSLLLAEPGSSQAKMNVDTDSSIPEGTSPSKRRQTSLPSSRFVCEHEDSTKTPDTDRVSPKAKRSESLIISSSRPPSATGSVKRTSPLRKDANDALGCTVEGLEAMNPPTPDPGSPAETYLQEAASTKVSKGVGDLSVRVGKTKIGRKYRKNKKAYAQPKGKVITEVHEQYALTYGMMMGIRVSVGLQSPFERPLTMDDFMKVNKMVFPPSGSMSRNFITPPHKLQHPFKFKDYAPDIFRQIRNRFNIDGGEYMVSLCGDFNYIEFISNSKSGQFFFYSHDGKYMIKTQTKAESKFLRRILPHYYKYVMDNPNTLITRFYGMHRVKMHHLRSKMRFVIMGSVFYTPREIHARFDLKGSTVGRTASEKDRQENGVLKDNDLDKDGVRILLGREMKLAFLDQVKKDVEFLQKMQIMDYSLLVGIHDIAKKDLKGVRKRSVTLSDEFRKETELERLRASSLGKFEDSTKTLPKPSTNWLTADRNSQVWSGDGLPPPNVLESRQNTGNIKPEETIKSEKDNSGSPMGRGKGSSFYRHDSSGELSPSMLSPMSEASSPRHAQTSDEDSSMDDEDSDNEDYHEDDTLTMDPLSPRLLQTGPLPVESVFVQDDGGLRSRAMDGRMGNKIYFMGVIDILQQYNSRKMAETFLKGFRFDRKQLSAVEPKWYAQRFVEYLDKHID